MKFRLGLKNSILFTDLNFHEKKKGKKFQSSGMDQKLVSDICGDCNTGILCVLDSALFWSMCFGHTLGLHGN